MLKGDEFKKVEEFELAEDCTNGKECRYNKPELCLKKEKCATIEVNVAAVEEAPESVLVTSKMTNPSTDSQWVWEGAAD